MNTAEQKELRRLQDRFLGLEPVRRFRRFLSGDVPLWGPGTPSFNKLQKELQPQYAQRIRELIRKWQG